MEEFIGQKIRMSFNTFFLFNQVDIFPFYIEDNLCLFKNKIWTHPWLKVVANMEIGQDERTRSILSCHPFSLIFQSFWLDLMCCQRWNGSASNHHQDNPQMERVHSFVGRSFPFQQDPQKIATKNYKKKKSWNFVTKWPLIQNSFVEFF